jgi:antitoxin StbD
MLNLASNNTSIMPEENAMDTIFSHITVSVTELKRNYANILKEADECPVAVLNHNRPEAYLLPAAHYERLMAYLEDLEDAKVVRERAAGPFVEVSPDEL